MMKIYGMEHVGFTVPDLDEAVHFFETAFGAVAAMETGPVVVDDAFMARRLGVPEHCRIENIKVMRCGNGANLELFEYSGETQQSALKRNSEVGGFHLAFQVDDTVTAADSLREKGHCQLSEQRSLAPPLFRPFPVVIGIDKPDFRSQCGQTFLLSM